MSELKNTRASLYQMRGGNGSMFDQVEITSCKLQGMDGESGVCFPFNVKTSEFPDDVSLSVHFQVSESDLLQVCEVLSTKNPEYRKRLLETILRTL